MFGLGSPVGHPDDVDDLTQQALMKAYEGIDSFRGDSSAGTWPCSIGARLAIDHLRARKRWREGAQVIFASRCLESERARTHVGAALHDPHFTYPNLFCLRNGSTFDLDGIVVGGVGGCHGPSNYGRRTRDLQGYAKRHYTREDIDRLIARGRLDLLLTHDAPAGVVFPRHRRGLNWQAISLVDLPLPSPKPAGSDWIEAYRHWLGGR